jgi:hypothetical protein
MKVVPNPYSTSGNFTGFSTIIAIYFEQESKIWICLILKMTIVLGSTYRPHYLFVASPLVGRLSPCAGHAVQDDHATRRS